MHFGFIAPPFPSHVAALDAVAAALAARGHRCTLFQQADVGEFLSIRSAFRFAAVGRHSHPPGSLGDILRHAARPGGPFGIRRVVQDMAEGTRMLCREVPALARHLRIDAIVGDGMEAAGGLIAARLGLPHATVCCALPQEDDPAIPPPFLAWPHDPSEEGRRRNAGAALISRMLMKPHARALHDIARAWSLPPRGSLAAWASRELQIWQLVPGLDFPRPAVGPHIHYAGPLRRRAQRPGLLGLPISGRRPLAYASLGTLQGDRLGLFRRIAAACRAIDVELVVSYCGRLEEDEARSIGADHVVAHVDQRALIPHCDLVITHAGLNTVLDALSFGVPVLALPIAFDQPGVAARVRHAGAGLVLSHRFAGRQAIARAALRIIEDPAFRSRAVELGAEIAAAGGAEGAASRIEAVAGARCPVPPGAA